MASTQLTLPDFSDQRILVIGDVMLDWFVYGTVRRISPEGPIPVLHVNRRAPMLGGAGNLARNVAALNGTAVLIGLVGDDEAGRTVRELSDANARFDAHLITASDGRPTTVKSRFVAGGQQLLRVDDEVSGPASERDQARLIASAERALDGADAVVLSDYAKGVLPDAVLRALIDAGRKAGVPVLTDPKSTDLARYRGITVLKPNSSELAAATGMPAGSDDEVVAAAGAALQASGAEAVIATRAERGMTLVASDGTSAHFPGRGRQVFDVSGAGDTVLAVLALMLGAGRPLDEAATVATLASGRVVEKSGTATVNREELAELVRARDSSAAAHKIVGPASLAALLADWREAGLSVGFTNGCFDLIHPGHASLLSQARAACDRLVVGLNSDASVRRLKGEDRPIQDERARAMVLAAIADVDAVAIFEEDTPLSLIETVAPDVLVKGADYTVETVVGADIVTARGGRVVLADLADGHSTTGTIRRMRRAEGGKASAEAE